MRLLLWCCLSAPLLAAASAETEVKAVLAQQEAAWNRADLNAFMQAYLNSPDITFVGKQVTRGWQGTLERYQKTYPTPAAMGRLTFSEIEVRPLGKDHAWVLGRFQLERTAAVQLEPRKSMRFTPPATRRWRIRWPRSSGSRR